MLKPTINEVKAGIVAAVANGFTRTAACAAGGIASNQFKELLGSDPRFHLRVEEAEEQFEVGVVKAIHVLAEKYPQARLAIREQVTNRVRKLGSVCRRIVQVEFDMSWAVVKEWIFKRDFAADGEDETPGVDIGRNRTAFFVRAYSRHGEDGAEVLNTSGYTTLVMIRLAMEQHIALTGQRSSVQRARVADAIATPLSL